MLPEIVVGDVEALALKMADAVEADARAAIAARGRFSIALSGGSVAAAFFPTLARLPLDWTHVDFFWCDERAVPPSHADSNYAAARALWLGPARVPEARIHRMPADAPDLAAAAAAYEAEMSRVSGTPPRLDVVLLGVGPDGHVASLFPAHAALAEDHRSVLAIEDSPKPPPRRLTLTVPVLAAAERVIVAATGKAKAEILREALEDESSALPLALVVKRARRAMALLDAEAASLLGRCTA
jgi:6-phosphogluconolactonase